MLTGDGTPTTVAETSSGLGPASNSAPIGVVPHVQAVPFVGTPGVSDPFGTSRPDFMPGPALPAETPAPAAEPRVDALVVIGPLGAPVGPVPDGCDVYRVSDMRRLEVVRRDLRGRRDVRILLLPGWSRTGMMCESLAFLLAAFDGMRG